MAALRRAAGAGGGGFVGAFDGISFAALYGLKRFLTAYTGNLIRLRRDSDNAESDFAPVAGTGLLDTAAIATWLGGANPFAVKVYDQSGNGRDLSQGAAASQPAFVASGLNGKPVLAFDGSNDWIEKTVVSFTLDGPCVITVVKSITIEENAGIFSASSGGADWNSRDGFYLAQRVATNRLEWSRAVPGDPLSATAAYSAGTWQVISGVQNAGAGAIYLNGGAAAGSDSYSDMDGTTTRMQIGDRYAGSGGYHPSIEMSFCALLDSMSTPDHNTIGEELEDLYAITFDTVS